MRGRDLRVHVLARGEDLRVGVLKFGKAGSKAFFRPPSLGQYFLFDTYGLARIDRLGGF